MALILPEFQKGRLVSQRELQGSGWQNAWQNAWQKKCGRLDA